jgi:predicted DNA-binding protein with PD1-like motif
MVINSSSADKGPLCSSNIFRLCCACFFLLLIKGVSAQLHNIPRYTPTPTGYIMVLPQGDDLFPELEKMARAERIPAAQFTGMGFATVKFGFFNARTRKYKPRTFKDMELASLTGTIAWNNDSISIHAHGVAGNKRFNTRSGHILAATVGTGSLEIAVTVFREKLERKMDAGIGANVLQLQE